MTQKDNNETVQASFRLPTELIDRIDSQVGKLRKRVGGGVRVNRSDVVRTLLQRGLSEAERDR